MNIADDIKTVLSNQAKLADAVYGIASKLDDSPATQSIDLKPELDLLNAIKADLEPTPAPTGMDAAPAAPTSGDNTDPVAPAAPATGDTTTPAA